MKTIVITGGHHTSALPVIEELRKRYPEIYISWFGHKYTLPGSKSPTLEYQEITSLSLPFYNLQAGKFYKTFNPFRLLKIPWGFFQALYWLMKLRPQVILSFGGYLAVPVVLAGWLLKIPSLTHEQTAVLGWANKLIVKFTVKILYTWPQSSKYFPVKKSKMVGLPLREEIFTLASDSFNLNKKLPTIYITTGKTGSHKINQVILRELRQLLENYNLIHQTGDYFKYKDHEKLLEKYKEISDDVKGSYHVHKFIYRDHIGEVFEKADFVISRSGAHICYELLALNKPAVLIPIPWVSHNEQYINAHQVKQLGLGEIFREKDLASEKFFKFVDEFFKNINGYKLKNDKIVVYDSAVKIVHEIEKVCQQKKNQETK